MPTATDQFCGAGGAGTGLALAGFDVKFAINHAKVCTETYAANHRTTDVACEDVSLFDVRRLPRTDVLWTSPECTWHSPAGGRKRLRAQLDMFEEHVPSDVGERSRATMFDVIRFAEARRYAAIIVENVVEVAAWPLFDWWLTGMTRTLEYEVQFVCVSAAHIGDGDNPAAPQWRDRFKLVFTRKGVRRPDLVPRPLAWCPECGTDVRAVQAWKPHVRRKIGKYRQQYVYRCPNTACRNAIVEPYVRPAASVIDWTNLGTRIGDRTRPLAPTTMERIRRGLDMIADRPAMITLTHGGYDPRTIDPAAVPFPVRTSKIGDALITPCGGTWNTTAALAGEPFRTRTTRETDALVVPNSVVVKLRRNDRPAGPESPLSTIAAGGNHHALVIPYRKGRPTTTAEPVHTIATRDSAALVDPADRVEDCRFRMLTDREHLLAQRFPTDYIVAGNKSERTLQAGNAVPCNVAQWIGAKLLEVL